MEVDARDGWFLRIPRVARPTRLGAGPLVPDPLSDLMPVDEEVRQRISCRNKLLALMPDLLVDCRTLMPRGPAEIYYIIISR